ncbi:hypothetical protein PG988_000134 [Apiospora saccharicola]
MPSKSKSKRGKAGKLQANVTPGPSSHDTTTAKSGQKRPRSLTTESSQTNKQIEDDAWDDQPTATFEFKGKKYTLFKIWELGYMNALLFTGKQSVSRLRDAGCFMMDEPNPFDVALSGYKKEDYISMPAYDPTLDKYHHVVIDCSFVVCEGDILEVSHLSVLNLLDAEELINSYVWPEARVIDWYGTVEDLTITKKVLKNASATEGVLVGWEAARSLLAEIIDAKTTIVGEHVCGILRALRISHTNVFDIRIACEDSSMDQEALQNTPCTYIWASGGRRRVWSEENGQYDYYEKALTMRERVIFCLKQPWMVRFT